MTADDKTCPSCGRQVPDDHPLCVKCGAKLDDPSALTGGNKVRDVADRDQRTERTRQRSDIDDW